MDKQTVFVKVLTSERLPTENKEYISSKVGIIKQRYFDTKINSFSHLSFAGDWVKTENVEYWLEEIEIPNSSDLATMVANFLFIGKDIKVDTVPGQRAKDMADGIRLILNILKGENK